MKFIVLVNFDFVLDRTFVLETGEKKNGSKPGQGGEGMGSAPSVSGTGLDLGTLGVLSTGKYVNFGYM